MCVRESGLRVTITDGAQRLGGRPSLVRAWQHPYSFTYPCRPYLPPLNLLLFLSFLFYYTPPQPPRLLLHMNNAGALLDRCYQHATACFIHAKLRQIPHYHRHHPLIADQICEQPPASKTSATARCVCSQGLLDPCVPAGERPRFFLEVNICI